MSPIGWKAKVRRPLHVNDGSGIFGVQKNSYWDQSPQTADHRAESDSRTHEERDNLVRFCVLKCVEKFGNGAASCHSGAADENWEPVGLRAQIEPSQCGQRRIPSRFARSRISGGTSPLLTLWSKLKSRAIVRNRKISAEAITTMTVVNQPGQKYRRSPAGGPAMQQNISNSRRKPQCHFHCRYRLSHCARCRE